MNFRNLTGTFAATLALCVFASAAPIDDLIQKGDVHDRQFRAKEALEYYLPAEKLDPNNADVLTRIARQYRHLMTDARSKSEKLRLGNIAVSYSRRAAALAPNDSDAQLSPAISHGKMLSFLSSREQVEASRVIKASAEKAVKLNPRNDLAWHVLGRWHRVLADLSPIKRAIAPLLYGKLPEARNEDAVACFQKAIAINPNRLMHYIELGRTYAQMGKTEEARRYLQKGLSMPNTEKDDPELKERGREALAKLS